MSPAQVSRGQSGTATWSLDDCDALAAYFDINVLELLARPSPAFLAVQRTQARHSA
ncbi:hypothetical protein ACGF0K_36050 [Streptomyces sp. NPDC048156]|uniref:hypothetical protein n=1 Tax=Streptomyces sp. NPDC048156 TaxID=3365502 RepID=UPI0037131AE2